MNKAILISILMIPFLSMAQVKKSNPKNVPLPSKIQNTKNSESKNIIMFAPSEGQHDFLFRLLVPTGTISRQGSDTQLSGYLTNLEYAYGINDNFSLGAGQSLLNEYKISSNTGETKYNGIGDTSVFGKYFLPLENIDFYFSSQYRMGLLKKSNKNYDTGEYSRVAERNNLSLEIGANFKFDIFSFGGLMVYKSFQTGETDIKSSGLSYTESSEAGAGHEVSVFSQLNLENFKLGLVLSEGVENEYESKISPGSSTITYSSSTTRQIMLYSIIPFTENFEGHFSVSKLEPKDKNDFTYNYYVLMGALRATF